MEAQLLTPGSVVPRARASVRASASVIVPLAAVTLLAAALRLWAFSGVPGNPFYDAAARSMTLSWHNFFFGAFEPGGQVSIDKAPGDLWLQVASAKLFGFSDVATRLPEVAAGIAAVPLLYDLVRRLFGRTAGLGAAAALAVLPAAVLTAHSDTMDSVMMLFDVLAAWLVVVGAQSRRVWPIVAAGAVLGLAFNVKLFQALVVAPPLVLLMLLAIDLPARRRALALGGSLLAFLAVSLSWVVTASLTPLGARPWPIGSTNGGIWNVVFMFNGVDRLRAPATPAALAGDPPGALRFFGASGHAYASTVGTTLAAALVLGAAGAAVALARRRRVERIDRLQLAGAVFFGTWLVFGVGVLSHMQRFQPRYLESVTPAIAAVAGAGLAALVATARPRTVAGAALVVAVAVTAAGGVLLTHPPTWAAGIAIAAVSACCLVAASSARRHRATALAALGLVAVLVVPASAAVSVAHRHLSDAGLPLRSDPGRLAALSRFLVAHQHGARYEVASATVMRAAPLIIRDARPVLMLTSYNGQPLVSAGELRRAVAAGQVRYALLGRVPCSSKRCSAALRWAWAHARDGSAVAGQPPGRLYRLDLTPARG